MEIYYNSKDINCKKPFGAVSNLDAVEFSVYCKDGVYVDKAFLRIYLDGQEDYVEYPLGYISSHDNYSKFSTVVNNLSCGLYWYHFVFFTEEGEVRYDKNGAGFQLTVFDSEYSTPKNMHSGIIYHIFVDRFNKGKDDTITFNKSGVLKNWQDKLTLQDEDGVYRANDFYGGNFQGIIDKLDYLKKLNVSIIYLSPIFKSSSNHRYDTGDYMQIDELLGSEEKFKELIDKAKKLGMSIMLDGVFNHTGADSLYFNKFNNYDSVGAFQSVKSPYYNWYTFYDYPDSYHCWWGVTVCPTIKPIHTGFRDLITNPINGVINKWTSLGVDGWRLDVVDELQEEFVKDIRKAVKKHGKDKLLIGEVWEDASNKIAYDYRRHYFQGEELDGVMNYVFKNAILSYTLGASAKEFKLTVDEIIENYPKQSLFACMNLIGTHDTERVLTYLGVQNNRPYLKQERLDYQLNEYDYKIAVKRLKIASAIEYMLPGIPSVYYGDERGMQGFEDPINRKTINWEIIDNEIFSHYVALGNIRKEYSDLMVQDTIIEENNLLILKRGNDKTITLVANTTNDRQIYDLRKDSVDLLTSTKFNLGRIIIEPNSVYIFNS